MFFASFYYCLAFFFNDTATTDTYTLSLHDALPISLSGRLLRSVQTFARIVELGARVVAQTKMRVFKGNPKSVEDRKSTRLNSSHANISYAVFCLKKKKKKH